ncbi:MAG: DUF4276 family protein [Glaciimonas sp.]|nr:DUF4276 family protein [Glaciimonas sp.]
MEHLVFFLEEPSAQDFLQAVLPRVLPAHITPHFLVFEGKQDLEKRLVLRMKRWLRPNSYFIVMRDQDSGDCVVIKARLRDLCVQAGQPDAVVRVVCKELESFFVGDWPAVAAGFERPALAANANRAKYRVPDLLGSPSAEIRRLIPTYQKREGARKIAPHLDLTQNKSNSFRVLMRSIQELTHA